MKSINIPLIIGSSILLILLILGLFGDRLSPRDPYEKMLIRTAMVDGIDVSEKAPYPPDATYILGSDILGRDILSRLIAGTRITLGIAVLSAVIKMILAVGTGIPAGMGFRFMSKVIHLSAYISGGIPALVLCLLILQLPFVGYIPILPAVIVYGAVIGLVEWGRVGGIMENQVFRIMHLPFVLGDYAVGKSNWQIVYTSILPHLMKDIIIHLSIEIGRSLLMIAKLGVFEVFVVSSAMDTGMFGDREFLGLSFDPEYYPEWGGMLASARYAINTHRLWVILSTVLMMFISILGFNLFGEGMKRANEQG